jgi:hypothetical protein
MHAMSIGSIEPLSSKVSGREAASRQRRGSRILSRFFEVVTSMLQLPDSTCIGVVAFSVP